MLRSVLATFGSDPPTPRKTVDFGTDFFLFFSFLFSFFFFFFHFFFLFFVLLFFFLHAGAPGGEPGSRRSQNNVVCVCEGFAGRRPATPSHNHG